MIVIAATIKSIFSICPQLPSEVPAVLLELSPGAEVAPGEVVPSNFCGMELQLAARVSPSARSLKPNKGHVRLCFMVCSGKMTVCVSALPS